MRAFETTTDLIPHQQRGVSFLRPLRVGGLFAEMGTGKSRIGIELAKLRAAKIDKVVWLSPVSLKDTVREEILKHTNCESRHVFVFDDRVNVARVPGAMWYCVGIESVSGSDRIALALQSLLTARTMVILDESQYCKSPMAKRTERISRYSEICRYRLLMTGTPVSQGAQDLYSQMKFLSPKILGYNSFYSFAANHLEYSDKRPGLIVRAHNEEYLAAKIAPYVFHVTKKECLTLPPKQYRYASLSLTEDQREQYEDVKAAFERLLDRYEDVPVYAIFKLFLSLQQVVSGFRRKRGGGVRILANNRIDRLMGIIDGIHGDEQIVIWAKFRFDIEQIGKRLEERFGKESVVYYHGDVSIKERNAGVRRFKAGARFFLATRSTGGHGLTLVNARYCIDYNKQFKYSEQLQAEDRIHRIGQTRDVIIIGMSASNTIDERIDECLSRKSNFAQLFADEMSSAPLSRRREMLRSL